MANSEASSTPWFLFSTKEGALVEVRRDLATDTYSIYFREEGGLKPKVFTRGLAKPDYAVEMAQILVRKMMGHKATKSSFADGGVALLSDDRYDAALDVASILELVSEMTCLEKTDEGVNLSAESVTGLYNLLQMAHGQIIGLARTISNAEHPDVKNSHEEGETYQE